MKILLYILLTIVFLVSTYLIINFSTNQFLATVMAVPAAGSMIAVVLGIIRDGISNERRISENNRSEYYQLGAASAMSDVLFKKHIDFCEEYIAATMDGIENLIRKGPNESALDTAKALYLIRRKHLAWITSDIAELLMPFEQAFRNIGADHLHLQNIPIGEERSKVVKALYDTYKAVMEMGDNDMKVEKIGHTKVIFELQNILGVNELHNVRKSVLRQVVNYNNNL